MNEDLIRKAYRKLKHYVYYDNTDLLLRKKVAEFEDEIEEGLADTLQAISEDRLWDSLLRKIKIIPTPKCFKRQQRTDRSSQTILTNTALEDDLTITKLSFHIDAPIEVHLLSTVWTMMYGPLLETSLLEKPYGNKLALDENDDVVDGLRLFEPYFKEYANWRDSGIRKVRQVVNENKHALIFGLDIKSCYDSIQFDFDKLFDFVMDIGVDDDEEFELLTDRLRQVHEKYSRLRTKTRMRKKSDMPPTILPIGLLSSGILANWHLGDFDRKVIEDTNPAYYGRYVDDIIIVYSSTQEYTSLDQLKPNALVDKYFKDSGILVASANEPTEIDKIEYCVLPEVYNGTLVIQQEKFTIHHFDRNEPLNLLDAFEAEIRKNSSEFRFMPSESELTEDFDEVAHAINYSDSPNKLRSIEDSRDDRYRIAKFLAKKLTLASISPGLKDQECCDQIVRFFNGWRALAFSGMWERTLTYLTLAEDERNTVKFVNQVLNAVDNVSLNNCGSKSDLINLRKRMKIYLTTAAAMAWGLKPHLLPRLHKLMGNNRSLQNIRKQLDDIKSIAFVFRRSNLIRHRFVACSLMSMTNLCNDESRAVDLTRHIAIKKEDMDSVEFTESALHYCPRYIKFHEVTLYLIHCSIGNHAHQWQSSKKYLEEAWIQYLRLNGYGLEAECRFVKTSSNEPPFDVSEISVWPENKADSLTVALANLRVDENVVVSRDYIEAPNPSVDRRKDLQKVLKESKLAKADFVVFPEISIPRHWLPWIAEYFVRRHKMAVVCGIEHWLIGNKVYNVICTLLPVKIHNTYEVVIVARVKNHPAPEEKRIIEGYGFEWPKIKTHHDLISWRNVDFTSFICFELADIAHRAWFRSRVDILIASEFNTDTNYFSNLAESIARDLHCIVVQSNSSQYGDSRAVLPSKTEKKDLLRVKGGDNVTVLTAKLPIKELRQFQLLEYELQKERQTAYRFKPTPPDFDRNEVKRRMKR
jgi:hypothetical protein